MLTFNVLLQDIIDDRIDVFVNISEEEREAVFDGHLQLLEEIVVIECAALQMSQTAKDKCLGLEIWS